MQFQFLTEALSVATETPRPVSLVAPDASRKATAFSLTGEALGEFAQLLTDTPDGAIVGQEEAPAADIIVGSATSRATLPPLPNEPDVTAMPLEILPKNAQATPPVGSEAPRVAAPLPIQPDNPAALKSTKKATNGAQSEQAALAKTPTIKNEAEQAQAKLAPRALVPTPTPSAEPNQPAILRALPATSGPDATEQPSSQAIPKQTTGTSAQTFSAPPETKVAGVSTEAVTPTDPRQSSQRPTPQPIGQAADILPRRPIEQASPPLAEKGQNPSQPSVSRDLNFNQEAPRQPLAPISAKSPSVVPEQATDRRNSGEPVVTKPTAATDPLPTVDRAKPAMVERAPVDAKAAPLATPEKTELPLRPNSNEMPVRDLSNRERAETTQTNRAALEPSQPAASKPATMREAETSARQAPQSDQPSSTPKVAEAAPKPVLVPDQRLKTSGDRESETPRAIRESGAPHDSNARPAPVLFGPKSGATPSLMVPTPMAAPTPPVMSGDAAETPFNSPFAATDAPDFERTLPFDSTRAPSPSPLPQRTDLARSIMQQMTAAVTQSGDGTIDVRLSPEDLGRVRLALSPSDLGMTVTISAERADTLDLVRRHIDMFAQDLRQNGFQNLSFSFGENRAGGDTANTPTNEHAETVTEDEPAQRLGQLPPVTASGRLDLRL